MHFTLTASRSLTTSRAPRRWVRRHLAKFGMIAVASIAAQTAGAQRPSVLKAPQIRNYHPNVLSRAEAIAQVQKLPGGPALLARVRADPSTPAGPGAGAGSGGASNSTDALSINFASANWSPKSNDGSIELTAVLYEAEVGGSASGPAYVVGGSPDSFASFVIFPSPGKAQLFVLSVDYSNPFRGTATFTGTDATPGLDPGAHVQPATQQAVSSCQPQSGGYTHCVVAVPASGVIAISMQVSQTVSLIGASLTWM